jgi:phosphotriesterase-related protein
MNRRLFVRKLLAATCGTVAISSAAAAQAADPVMTVRGFVNTKLTGKVLVHEHMLVDFSGVEKYDPSRWDVDLVVEKVLPFVLAAKRAGCQTIVDCTPAYLGRDPALLLRLSDASGVNFVTNTGYYGGSDEKFLPAHAFRASAQELADLWIAEWKNGIDNTGIRPGFMKISVNPGPLSPASKKLISAAALAHLESGLTIFSHTGPAIPAFEQLEILGKSGVGADAFVWVHAQNEKSSDAHIKAARAGCWVSLDGLNDENVGDYVSRVTVLKGAGCLHRTLVSHDAGWYEPGKPGGGNFRGFTTFFDKLLPALLAGGFTTGELEMLSTINPRNALAIGVRRK